MEDPKILQVTREELKEMTEQVVVKLDEKIDSKLDTKLEKFRKDFTAETKIESPGEAIGKMIWGLWKGGQDYKKTLAPQTVGTAADGGYLAPTITAPEILRLIEEYGQARQYMRQYPMYGKIVTVPHKLTGATATRVNENTEITDTKVTLDTVTLTASKVAAILAMSTELEEDSIVDIGQYVNEQLAEAFAYEEDTQFFAGTGSPHTGLFNASSTYGVNTVSVANVADVTYNNLIDMVRGIKTWYLRNAAWYMHRTVYGVLEKIKDGMDRPLFMNAGDPLKSTLFGYPVRLIEAAPNSDVTTASMPFILLGNITKSLIGIKRELRVQILTEATVDSVNLAANDLIGVKMTKRDAFAIAEPLAYSVCKIAA